MLARNAPVAVPFFCGRVRENVSAFSPSASASRRQRASPKKFGTVPAARWTRVFLTEQCVKSMRCFEEYACCSAFKVPFFVVNEVRLGCLWCVRRTLTLQPLREEPEVQRELSATTGFRPCRVSLRATRDRWFHTAPARYPPA